MNEATIKALKKEHSKARVTKRGQLFAEYCAKIVDDDTYTYTSEDEKKFENDILDGMKKYHKTRQDMAKAFLEVLKVFDF